MTIGNIILTLRKEKGLTQEALAKALNVTNQAVSKWESDQCCPDTMLLPRIADYFEISIDELFGRPRPAAAAELPWEDDGSLRVVTFIGKKLLRAEENPQRDISFRYEGPALNIESYLSVQCDNVHGNVTSGGSVNCDQIGGSVSSGSSVNSDVIQGNVNAAGNVTCDEIRGNVVSTGSVISDSYDGMNIPEDLADRISGVCEKVSDDLSKIFPFGRRQK